MFQAAWNVDPFQQPPQPSPWSRSNKHVPAILYHRRVYRTTLSHLRQDVFYRREVAGLHSCHLLSSKVQEQMIDTVGWSVF